MAPYAMLYPLYLQRQCVLCLWGTKAQGSDTKRPTPRRASEATTQNPPHLPVRCVGRGTALGAILGLPAPEILKYSKITCSTLPQRRGVAAVGRAAGSTANAT